MKDEFQIPVSTLKVFNNFENSGLELKMLKNFTFHLINKKNYTDYDSRDNFFSEMNGEFYQINRMAKRKIQSHQSFNQSRSMPNSVLPLEFSKRSSGVRVGNYLWIVGGGERVICMLPKHCISQRKSKIWNIKKFVWTDGPELPKSIWMYHAAASAINSSHVVFVGANAYFGKHNSSGLI